MRSLRRARRPLVALVALVVALIVGYSVKGGSSSDAPSHPTGRSSTPAGSSAGSSSGRTTDPANGAVALSSLPPQAAATVTLIRSGGPFPYPRNDGVVFHNAEHRLPREPDGWYHEYTVPTPGSSTRGARRIVTGRDGTFFYTGDHYETFERVDVTR